MKIKIIFFLIIIFLNKSQEDLPNKAIYNIILYNRYLNYEKGRLQISFSKRYEGKANFRIRKVDDGNAYYIEHISSNLLLSANSSELKLVEKSETNDNNTLWFIDASKDNKYTFQNYNQCYLYYRNNILKCENIKVNDASKFILLKLCNEVEHTKEDLELIEKEPIDVVVKYIDLSDPNLKREGITHLKKDEDNQELKYCIRSILKNIPWIRNIVIILPNEKVRFLKDYDLIKEKIVYINDKDFLGFDSANSNSFQFNLWRLKKFNVSENIILMDDDYFIGKPLNKSDFFYVNDGKVVPAIVSTNYVELSKNIINARYNTLKKKAEKVKEKQNSDVFQYSLINTFKFVLRKLDRASIVIPIFTHNAIPFNLDKVKEIYNITYNSEFKEPTLFSIYRGLEALQFQTTYVVYNFNKNRNIKVSLISYAYHDHTKALKQSYKESLFVINTGGEEYAPITFKKARIVMEKLFPEPTPYEITDYSSFPLLAFNTVLELDNNLKVLNKNAEKYKDVDEKMKQSEEKIKQSEEKIKENEEKMKKDGETIKNNEETIKSLDEKLKNSEKTIKNYEEKLEDFDVTKETLKKYQDIIENNEKELKYFRTLKKFSNETNTTIISNKTFNKIISDNIVLSNKMEYLEKSKKIINYICIIEAILLFLFLCNKLKNIRSKQSMEKIKLISSENDINELNQEKRQKEYYYLMNEK